MPRPDAHPFAHSFACATLTPPSVPTATPRSAPIVSHSSTNPLCSSSSLSEFLPKQISGRGILSSADALSVEARLGCEGRPSAGKAKVGATVSEAVGAGLLVCVWDAEDW